MRIGMFDSGVGGLTVLKSFIKYHPNNEYFYYGDTLNVPYGDKTKEELIELSKKIIKYLENKKVDIIIIACGTISSNVYDDLTKITNIPIYSIIKETINYAYTTINTLPYTENGNSYEIGLKCQKVYRLLDEKGAMMIRPDWYFKEDELGKKDYIQDQ